MNKSLYLSSAQFKAEINRCLNCRNQPCMQACPVHCNPHDFIAKAKAGDFTGAVEVITRSNPMGETCGLICPDKFCMKACTRANLDFPINIPKVQALIMEKYRNTAVLPSSPKSNGYKIAVIGAGPAGIAAAAKLIEHSFKVVIFEADDKVGGALNLIPDMRLPSEVIEKDWEFIKNSPLTEVFLNSRIKTPQKLLDDGYDALIIASGEPNTVDLGVAGEDLAISYVDYLKAPQKYNISGGNAAIIGGGAVAVDCALTARTMGAKNVEMFVRRRISDMRITGEERQNLLDDMIDITTMTGIKGVTKGDNGKLNLLTCKNYFDDGRLREIAGTQIMRPDFDIVIKAIGSSSPHFEDSDRIVYAGDCKTGGSTLVEALASGIEAAQKISALLLKEEKVAAL
ncbi:MAG: FAD-dependent oxidoreductase [Alphaproteobacteria bacterium]|nr:FAD-dependent oxidoreductase [Alphaproteobacteria bacterium]